jgi:protein-L-isoaspartate(D-aspartate) O-methyltransferase
MSEVAYNTVNLFETSVKPLRNAIVPSPFKF